MAPSHERPSRPARCDHKPTAGPKGTPYLGNYGSNHRNPGHEGAGAPYCLLRWLWRESTLKGISKCHRVRYGDTVKVWGDGNGRVGYGGFCRCHSVWACPLCAPIIRKARAVELSAGLVRHLLNGGGCVFATFTIPHNQGDRLAALFDGVTKGWGEVLKDRAVRQWMGDHRVEWIRASEVTHGRNGWHPHLHTSLVTERPLERAEAQELQRAMFGPWCRSVERSGWRPPSEKYGLSVIRCSSGEIGNYVSKIEGLADEMTRLDAKRAGKTDPPFVVLRRAVDGDEHAASVWREYEQGTKGRRALMPSRGLRERLGLGAELPDSLQADPSERSWRVLGVLDRYEADVLVTHPQGFEVFAESVGDGSPEAWRAALETLRGTMPWWLSAWGRAVDKLYGEALLEDEARKFVGVNVGMFVQAEIGF